jgi:hypothetical protein
MTNCRQATAHTDVATTRIRIHHYYCRFTIGYGRYAQFTLGSTPTLQQWSGYTADPTGNLPNWEYWWDLLPEDLILKYAPFKLMAIVNRLDVRGSQVYGNGINNAGETRFIFTLINPLTGMPPHHDEIFFAGPQGAIDWVGMNVILEYGNPQTSLCELQNFAKQWYDLSSYTLGSATYNQALQTITDQVTNKQICGLNNHTLRLNQVRTNEKIFFPIFQFANAASAWAPPNWELRQFELDANGFLSPALVSNTLSNAPSLNEFGWIYGPLGNSPNRTHVYNNNYNLDENLLDGAAEMTREMIHFRMLNWSGLPANIPNVSTNDDNADMPNDEAKTIRHNISLNTCQGCHGGETKTNFTMMQPRGYGEAANYWDATPSYQTLTSFINNTFIGTPTIDNRFVNQGGTTITNTDNPGSTFDLYAGGNVPNHNSAEKVKNQKNQIVSPFLTGRKLSSVNPTTGLHDGGTYWEDDELDNSPTGNDYLINPTTGQNIFSDEKLTGWYLVNDPSNESASLPTSALTPGLMYGKGGSFPQIHTKKWRFNDLQRRQDDLCSFIQTPCSNGGNNGGSTGNGNIPLFVLMKSISFIPMPLHSH